MKILVFQWFRYFVGSPPFGASSWLLASLLLAFSWLLAIFLLASSCPLAGFSRASCWILASLFAGFVLASCWPPGLLLASFWPLARLLLASCWPLAGLLLASCWPLAGLLLATSFPTKISLENRFFARLAKLVNSLHENSCFSMVSVFRGVPSIWGLLLASSPLAGFLASCWPLAGLLLASCWLLAGLLLASCWLRPGLLLASCWPRAGFLLASWWLQASPRNFSRKSVFHMARKIGEFSS